MSTEIVRVNTLELSPTQPCIGRFEVNLKKDRFKLMADRDIDGYLKEKSDKGKPVQVVKRLPRYYIIDGHHTLTAILSANEPRDLELEQVADFSNLEDDDAFWKKMEKKGWVLKRKRGEDVSPTTFPDSLDGLEDDPFRTLAWLVRKMEGFVDLKKPYVEFHIADYLRERMQFEPKHRYEYETAAMRAFELMRSKEATKHFEKQGLDGLVIQESWDDDLLKLYYSVLESARAPRYYRASS